jgi:hypothetical protein
MHTDEVLYPVNTKVMTPNGKGVVQGFQVEHGRIVYMVRHVIKEMTSMTGKCLTPKSAALDPRYPTGMWQYDIAEVTYA